MSSKRSRQMCFVTSGAGIFWLARIAGWYAHHEHLFVVRAVEDADAAALRQALHGAPEIVVVEIGGGRRLERVDLAALRVDPRHDVLDRAVLAGGVHRLEDQQQRPAILGVELVLQLGQQLDAGLQELLGVILLGHLVGVTGIDVLEREPLPGFDPVALGSACESARAVWASCSALPPETSASFASSVLSLRLPRS